MVTRRRFLGFLGALVFLAGAGLCLPAQGADIRILIVGDSWANDIRVWHSMEAAFRKAGMASFGIAGATTAVGGSEAAQWATKEYQDKIAAELAAHPTIDTVHLIIGGNDLINKIRFDNVFKKWDEKRRLGEWRIIAANIRKIVEFCLSNPQVKHVALIGYDYFNAQTAKESLGARGHEFHFGGMTQVQVNQCFIEVERLKLEMAKEIKGCTYVQNFGLAQHFFDEPKGAPAPGGPPDYKPFPGGNPEFAMPDRAFNPVDVAGHTYAGDGIHPNKETQERMCLHAIDLCYREWFAAK